MRNNNSSDRNYKKDSKTHSSVRRNRSFNPNFDNKPKTRFVSNDDEGGEDKSKSKKKFIPRGDSMNQHRSRLKKPRMIREAEDGIRLNKFIANAGVCSRREADEFIQAGVVKVNGQVVTELGVRVKDGDTVHFHDQLIRSEEKVYVLLNKPKNCVTTAEDPQGRLTVVDIVRGACRQRLYPVGRLDRNTTGLLLLTNDGDLTLKLTHPSYEKKKIYQVTLDKPLEEADYEKIMSGIRLEDGPIAADALEYVEGSHRKEVGIEIHSGRNRIVRRIFESLGYQIEKLDRVYFAGLTKHKLERGKWRFLTEQEIVMLKMGSYE